MSIENGLRRTMGRGLSVTFAVACAIIWALSSIVPGGAAAQPLRPRSRDAGSSTAVSVAASAAKVRRADHALVTSAYALQRCKVVARTQKRLHGTRCNSQRRALQRAGARLAATEHALASRVCNCGRDNATAARLAAPDLRVSGDTLAWSPGDHSGEYVIRRTVAGQAAHYLVVRKSTVTPPPLPGVEASYSVRDAARTAAWSSERRIHYSSPQTEDPQAAPAITVTGEVLSWNVVAGVKTYVVVAKAPGVAAVYSVVAGTTFTPVAVPGVTVEYSVRTAVSGSAWAPVVRISFPAAPVQVPVKEPTEPAERPGTIESEGTGERSGSLIAGVVGLVSGPLSQVNTFKSVLHTRYMRLDAGNGVSGWYSSDMPATITEVVTKDDVTPLILYNPAEAGKETLVGRPVATVRSEVKALGEVMHGLGLKWMEFGNEEYFYEQPGEYARQYLAAVEGLKGLGITLIANSWGDYWNDEKGAANGYWSDVVADGGWWVDFVNDLKGIGGSLPAACSLHPYGSMTGHEYLGAGGGPSGWMSIPAMHNWMVQKGMAAPIWITEVGQETFGGGAEDVTEEQKASDIRQYVENAQSWSYVQGLFIYSATDSLGQGYGMFNPEGAPTLAASAFGQTVSSLGLASS